MAFLLQMLRDSRSIQDLERHVSVMKVFSEDRQLFLLFYQTRETSPKGVYVREFWSHLPSCLIPHTGFFCGILVWCSGFWDLLDMFRDAVWG